MIVVSMSKYGWKVQDKDSTAEYAYFMAYFTLGLEDGSPFEVLEDTWQLLMSDPSNQKTCY
jgi:hypothetical protein